MNRWPQTWLGRAVWLMLGIAAAWVAYKFGSDYFYCRAGGSGKGACIASALFDVYLDVLLLITSTIYKILYFVLP